ncbi:MAG: VPGUxxT family thioredoxin-like (seleno)protein, type 2 [Phycisphaerales bacterium]
MTFLNTAAFSLALLAIPVVTMYATSSPRTDGPTELGTVDWLRDFDVAMELAQRETRPVLVLFQEIPGCATCVDFGRLSLSHPLLVEAIETEFIPLAIHNNKSGPDAEVCARFNEPSWNFPVVRFLADDASDIIAREERVWTSGPLAARMIQALETAGQPVPGYLEVVAAEESGASRAETAVFAMDCYWEGEARFGSVDGVLATRAAWQDGLEVVEVTFDVETLSFTELAKHGQEVQCASRIFAQDDEQDEAARQLAGDAVVRSGSASAMRPAQDSDQKYHLKRTALRYLPLTPMQAARVNAALLSRADVKQYLSPHQWELAAAIDAALGKNPSALEGFTPPEAISELAEYTRRLEAVVNVRD